MDYNIFDGNVSHFEKTAEVLFKAAKERINDEYSNDVLTGSEDLHISALNVLLKECRTRINAVPDFDTVCNFVVTADNFVDKRLPEDIVDAFLDEKKIVGKDIKDTDFLRLQSKILDSYRLYEEAKIKNSPDLEKKAEDLAWNTAWFELHRFYEHERFKNPQSRTDKDFVKFYNDKFFIKETDLEDIKEEKRKFLNLERKQKDKIMGKNNGISK